MITYKIYSKRVMNQNKKSFPIIVQRIVGEEYELERVPGNGVCRTGLFPKHAYDNVELGPKIGRELNRDIADNFWHYKQLL